MRWFVAGILLGLTILEMRALGVCGRMFGSAAGSSLVSGTGPGSPGSASGGCSCTPKDDCKSQVVVSSADRAMAPSNAASYARRPGGWSSAGSVTPPADSTQSLDIRNNPGFFQW